MLLLLFLLLQLWGMLGVLAEDVPDVSLDPLIFTSKSLPLTENGDIDFYYLPYVGNGYVASKVYTDTVHITGVYNGKLGLSHRARVPSRNNINIELLDAQVLDESYSLHVEKGYFQHIMKTDTHTITHTVFAHQVFARTLVTEIRVETISTSNIAFRLKSNPGNTVSHDIDFSPPETFEYPHSYRSSGKTKILEDESLENEYTSVTYLWTEPDETFIYNVSNTVEVYISTYDEIEMQAEEEFIAAYNQRETLLDTHVEAWRSTWNKGGIEITGNLMLSKPINGVKYYMLSSLPPLGTTFSDMGLYYGLSPGGLANGGDSPWEDYLGHNFWDTETWMYPAILMLWPDHAKSLLNYRISKVAAARKRAAEGGYEGIQFGWESARTGVDVTQPGYEVLKHNQIHITADIAYAARLYMSSTRDLGWLSEESGYDLIHECARFWVSRTEKNEETKTYDITKVMGPDESNPEVNNNVYTNVAAAYSVFYNKYATCLQGSESDLKESEDWNDVARSISLPYDSERNYHPQYDGYEYNSEIKQADTVLVGYPYQYPMKQEIRANDLDIYAAVTAEWGPAMTWGMHSIGYLELDDKAKADEYFNKAYQPYVHQPFWIWTEYHGAGGAVNFMTGMGGWMQNFLFGYLGMRLKTESLEFRPQFPPDTTAMKLNNLAYLGSTLTISFSMYNITVEPITTSVVYPLQLLTGNEVFILQAGNPFSFSAENFVIETTVATNCELPEEIIGIPFNK